MKVKELFPSRYLKADDLGTHDLEVEIREVKVEDVNGETKAVLYSTGSNKGLVLNKTNADVIAYTFGEDTDLWGGRKIVLFATRTQFQGKLVPCVRVRVPRPVAADDPPF